MITSTQVKQAFAAAGIKVRVADQGLKFRICRMGKPGEEQPHDLAASSVAAASLGLTCTGGKLGGQLGQAHEMIAYKPGAARALFSARG